MNFDNNLSMKIYLHLGSPAVLLPAKEASLMVKSPLAGSANKSVEAPGYEATPWMGLALKTSSLLAKVFDNEGLPSDFIPLELVASSVLPRMVLLILNSVG